MAHVPKLMNISSRRLISYSNLSNKRITRLSSDVELDKNARLINRNPRNLEQLSVEPKPTGFWLEKSPPYCRLRLVLEEKDNELNASLQHWSGCRLVEASTKEARLSKYFKNPTSSQAASVIAQVFSRRCLQSGYLRSGIAMGAIESGGPKVKIFFDTLKSNGFTIGEEACIVPRTLEDE